MVAPYFSPLKGLKAISEYIVNRAETPHIAKNERYASALPKQINSSKLKPDKANTPPHMPKITRFATQK